MANYAERHDALRFAKRSVRRRYRVMERVILDAVRTRSRVLDLGCGTGRFTTRIGARDVIGIDRDRLMLAVAQRRNVRAVLGNASALPFADACFDAVVATDHVFNVIDQGRALHECARVLVSSGIFAIHYGTDCVWSPRNPLRLTPRPGAAGLPAHAFIELAFSHGFTRRHVALWRWLRFYPYLVPVPPAPRLRIWNQGILVFAKS